MDALKEIVEGSGILKGLYKAICNVMLSILHESNIISNTIVVQTQYYFSYFTATTMEVDGVTYEIT